MRSRAVQKVVRNGKIGLARLGITHEVLMKTLQYLLNQLCE